MGSGDWNDGMNLVGAAGKGESVWLGFFLHRVLTQFAAIATAHGDTAFAERCEQEAAQIDGTSSRTAGTASGTAARTSMTDRRWGRPRTRVPHRFHRASWSVLSGAGSPERSRAAMEAVTSG